MKQQKINKAFPAVLRLCEFRLPIKKARELYAMQCKMKEHFEFALAEEQKRVTEFHGTFNQNGSVIFSNQKDFDGFQVQINELNESEVEWDLSQVVLTESDIGEQTISVSDISALEGFVVFE